MYLIRETFQTHPGKAKELVRMFKAAIPHFMQSEGGSNYRIMTDITGPYWTVVMEMELEDVGPFISGLRQATGSPELRDILKGYADLIVSGSRAIYILE